MRIDDGVKREILARADIGEVIGTYVQLRKRGNDLVGLCPFHGEKSPSLHVPPRSRLLQVLSAAASAATWLTFVQSRRTSASPTRCGCSASATASSSRTRTRAPRALGTRRRRSITPTTLRGPSFTACCSIRTKAPAQRRYCTGRGISDATIEAFALGYAPRSWDALVDELRRNDVAPEVAVQGRADQTERARRLP